MPRSHRIALTSLLLLAPALAGGETLRLEGELFGGPAAVEAVVVDRAAAEPLLRESYAELARAESEVRQLEERARVAAGEPFALSGAELELLLRAAGFCLWSEGTTGPLGGELYRLWGLRRPAAGLPRPDQLQAAAERARCERLALDPRAGTGRLAPGSELELFPFESGWAVDRALAVLRAAGFDNARVEAGGALRAIGGGPEGKGWRVELPAVPGLDPPLGSIYLRDQAAALLGSGDRPLGAGGERRAAYLDQRTGRPAEGVLLTVVVTDLAVDARATAQALFVLGPRPGQLFLSGLRPQPAVLWLVGSGAGAPVQVEAGWSKVPKR